ncbi:hypothetical protein CC2G_013491 [Coprinopsis cinerea AmutBmut pab1-1]|nr:hypothetical protein CC2G_013491 [Coprinopsis cinerea AmutBmut pab1-1]
MIKRPFVTLFLVLTAALALPQIPTPDVNVDVQKVDDDPTLTLAAETSECPEIVPGPGLPSLASLNLTSADLCKSPEEFRATFLGESELADAEPKKLVKRYTPWCNSGSPRLDVAKAQGCYNYLYALGSTTCHVPPTGSRFCHSASGSKDVAWYGTSGNGWSTQSTCREVAMGGQWVLDNCLVYITSPFIMYYLDEGANAAWDNENLIVRIGPY